MGGGFYNINVKKCYNNNEISGFNYIGGIIGGAMRININSCYNTKKVSGNKSIGGIIGLQGQFDTQEYTDNSIWYCYNTGNITGNEIVGSIAGHLHWYSSDYTHSLNGTTSKNVGIYENYKGDGSHFGLLSKTDLVSMILTNYGSNFKEDTASKNDGYPILSWQ